MRSNTFPPAAWPFDKIERWPLPKFVPYARKAHSEQQVDQIAASMREWGWTNPIPVAEDGTIIAGHGRLLAAKKLGIADVPLGDGGLPQTSRRDRERAITPAPKPRQIEGVPRGRGTRGKRRTAWWGWEDSNRQPSGYQPQPASSESDAHKHGIEDGRRKDWHSAANRAVVSSSWSDCLSGILPRRLDAEAGLRW